MANANVIEEEPEETKKSPIKIEPEKVDIPKFLVNSTYFYYLLTLYKTKFSSTYFRRSTNDEVQTSKDKGKDKNAKNNNKNKDQEKTKKLNRRRQNSLDYQRIKANATGLSTTNINLLTVPETEGERTKTADWDNTSRFGLRPDKGKDFFANLTDRTGVSGIIPSGIMTSKTDRFQTGGMDTLENKDYSPLTSNDSYILPSKDTEAPLRPYRPRDKHQDKLMKDKSPGLSTANTPDISPLGIMESPLEIEESQITISRMHRRVQSMQDVSPTQVISLSEALESPKVKESARGSARGENQAPIKSPTSDSSAAVQCLICFDNAPDAVFMECGHGGKI